MNTQQERMAGYKRAVLFFIIFSAYFYITTDILFLRLMSIVYFIAGFALIGAIAALVMLLQHNIEVKLKPKYWIINIIIDIIAYGVFTWLFFNLVY